MPNSNVAKHRRWWTNLAGFFIWAGIQFVSLTLRIRNEREVDEEEYDRVFLASLWHNRNFACPYVWGLSCMERPMGVVTSASKDGALLESVVRRYGMISFRGSSHRRGATAFLEAKQSVIDGACLTITPDGPRGPVYKIRPGIIKLASMTGVPIVPVCIDYEDCWRVRKAWDKYCIPKPFSRMNILWKKPFYVPPDIDDETLMKYVEDLELLMSEGRPDFEPIGEEDHGNY